MASKTDGKDPKPEADSKIEAQELSKGMGKALSKRKKPQMTSDGMMPARKNK